MRPKPGSLFMRFLALFWGSDWRRHNGDLFAAADQDGQGAWERPGRASASSPRQAEEQKERAVQLFGRFRVDAANNPPNAVAAERDQFIRHDLRPETKTVLWRNLDQRPEQKAVLQVRPKRTDQN